MEKMGYVNHLDIMNLNDFDFIDVYFKCLTQFYPYYKEKLLGLSYSYVLSNGERVNLIFNDECCMHLLGMNFTSIKTFLEVYSDYLNLDYIDISSKKSNEILDIIMEKKDLILKLCRRAKIIRNNNDILNEFIVDFRNCLSDYSMEKFEAIYVLGENIGKDYFKQFVVINPKWTNVDHAVVFVDKERVFVLGTVIDDFNNMHISSIRNYKKFDSNFSNCFDGCDVCIIKSCVCTRNDEIIKLSTNYNSYDFILSNIKNIKSFLKGVNYNLDVSSAYSSIISQLNFLFNEYGFYLPEAKQFFSCISDGDFYQNSSFHGEVKNPIYSKFNEIVKTNKEMWILIQKLLKEVSELKTQVNVSKSDESSEDCVEDASISDSFRRKVISRSSLIKLNSVKMKLLANKIKNPYDKRVSTRGLENYSISQIYDSLGSLSSQQLDLLFKSYVGKWDGSSYLPISRKELDMECTNDFNYTKRVILECLKANILYLNELFKDKSELFDKISHLEERQQMIICLKYGLFDSKCYTLEEVNRVLIDKEMSPATSYEFDQILNSIVRNEKRLLKR